MAKKKNPLPTIGIDTEGRPVVGGLFKMADTYGFPLSCSLIECESRNLCPGIAAFIEDSKKAGWPGSRTAKRIQEAYSDADMSSVWETIKDKVLYLCRY